MNALPHGWRDVSLGDICEFKYGKSLPDGKRVAGNVPVYGSNGIIGWHNEAITEDETIVVGRKGSFGEVHYSTCGCWPIDTTYYIDSKATKVDRRWLARILATLGLTRLNKAATIPGLNREDAYRLRLVLPPPSEQRRIAGILDRADALRVKRRETLRQIDALTYAVFTNLFGAAAVGCVSLAEVTTRITDGTHLTPKFVDAGIPFIFVKNVRNGAIDFSTDKYITVQEYDALRRRCPVDTGDVLYTSVGATYGHAALVGTFTKFAFQRHIAHIKPNPTKIVPEFLATVMQLPIIKKQADRWARGAAQPTINLKELREFQIPLPPISLQLEFARRIAGVESLKSSHRASLAELDALFASLQHRAFRGEL